MSIQNYFCRQGGLRTLSTVLPLFLCLCLYAALPLQAFAQPSQADLKESLRQLLKENPELVLDIVKENPKLVLDILKDNSETVLEIAQQGSSLRKRKAIRAAWDEDIKKPKKIDLEGRAFLGKTDAPVTIVAYSDFTCSYCRQEEPVLAALLKKYQGKVRYTFKALPKSEPTSTTLAKYSTAAFMLDPEKGWKLYEELFRSAEKFERQGEDYIKEVSASLGFDYNTLKAESESSKVKDRLEADGKEADILNISGTPHFLVNDLVIRGAVDQELFAEGIEKALGAVSK